MRLDVVLVTPERLIADGSAVYKGREKIAEGSFDFVIENRAFMELSITYADGVIDFNLTRRQKP